jgi:hypothetical protein
MSTSKYNNYHYRIVINHLYVPRRVIFKLQKIDMDYSSNFDGSNQHAFSDKLMSRLGYVPDHP